MLLDLKGMLTTISLTLIYQPLSIVLKFTLNYYSLANGANSQYVPPTTILYEINISQTQVKSPKATKSIFHRQEVIKSLDPDLPVFEAASSPVVSSGMAACHLKPQPSGFGPVTSACSVLVILEIKAVVTIAGCMWSFLATKFQTVALSLWNEPAEIQSPGY